MEHDIFCINQQKKNGKNFVFFDIFTFLFFLGYLLFFFFVPLMFSLFCILFSFCDDYFCCYNFFFFHEIIIYCFCKFFFCRFFNLFCLSLVLLLYSLSFKFSNFFIFREGEKRVDIIFLRSQYSKFMLFFHFE